MNTSSSSCLHHRAVLIMQHLLLRVWVPVSSAAVPLQSEWDDDMNRSVPNYNGDVVIISFEKLNEKQKTAADAR